jgi:hypothetical protein
MPERKAAPPNKAFKLTRSRKAWRHFVPPRLGWPSQLNAMFDRPHPNG